MSERSDIPGGSTERAAQLLGALGDPTRLAIVRVLSEGPACVCDLSEAVGISQSGVSHQLRYLRDRGFVSGRKSGRHVEYRLNAGAVNRVLDEVGALVPASGTGRGGCSA